MKIIIITSPDHVANETGSIIKLLDSGLIHRVHLRKPSLDETRTRLLIESVPDEYRSAISLHDHFNLAKEYGIGGIHLNSRHPEVPYGFSHGLTSCSCHSIQDVNRAIRELSTDYCFLSPVFDSVSKTGYKGRITSDDCRQLATEGLLDGKVFALSGVTPEKIPLLKEAGFKGAAILGAAWSVPDITDFLNKLKNYL